PTDAGGRPMSAPDLSAAAAAVDAAQSVVDRAAAHLAANGGIDPNQAVAYDLAHAASAVDGARALLDYGAKGDVEGRITCAFAADAVWDVASKILGREAEWGVEPGVLDGAAMDFVRTFRSPAFLAGLAGEDGPRHLDSDFEMVQDTFRRFAEDKVRPVAEHVHRHNEDIPEDIISGLAEIGTFGLSVPEEYGGFAGGGESDYFGMVVATEELSRGSLGVAGSLITRPEILTRALVKGGTEEQKQEWLPRLASGEVMAAVAVTEPDYGSDAANVKVTAKKVDGGWQIDGVKTWCTFAARADALMLLARTDPDRSKAHRGLSIFIVPKPRGEGHGFAFTQDGTGGKMEGRAIDTIGYRGMHSYEVSFDGWVVPDDHLIGGEAGLGQGFYWQMAGFENGRLQTAARAIGVMQAAYEAARQYSEDRVVFGQPIGEYQLTQVKLARMAVIIQAARQYAYAVGRLMAKGEGTLEAAMCKAYVCKAAEWVAREAMQIHGGMGYAEEYAVSRYFVDARVLSIFEGADETLCLKLIARRLLDSASAASK
ncbi:MAG TPA: acyl-CoA dehydrogenase family protein, partial [Acidimicrobiales bacterium]|nr:acyl-CoA dehydrogenase family protein [Acidimicrobiales bacterium]